MCLNLSPVFLIFSTLLSLIFHSRNSWLITYGTICTARYCRPSLNTQLTVFIEGGTLFDNCYRFDQTSYYHFGYVFDFTIYMMFFPQICKVILEDCTNSSVTWLPHHGNPSTHTRLQTPPIGLLSIPKRKRANLCRIRRPKNPHSVCRSKSSLQS